MKKYLWMLAVLLVAASSTSCEPDEKKPDSNFSDVKVKTASNVIYYGEEHGAGTAFYTLTMANAEGKKLRLDCFGTISVNTASARLTTGDYKVGDMETRAVRTFVLAKTEQDTIGTIFWDNDTAYLITSGTITVSAVGTRNRIVANLKSGETSINCTFDGTLKFEDRNAYPAHEAEVIKAKSAWGQYIGKGMSPESTTGQFVLVLVKEGDASNKDTHAIQIEGFMPQAAANNNAMIAEGTYNMENDPKAEPKNFTILAGAVEKSDATGTSEYFTNDEGLFTHGWIMSEGQMVVTKAGDIYDITLTLKGQRVDRGGNVGERGLEDIKFSYSGALQPLQNYADPMSNIKKSVDLGDIKNSNTIIQIANIQSTTASGWLFYIFGEGVIPTITGENLTLAGKGNMAMFFLQGPKSSEKFPVGEYPMADSFYIYPSAEKNICVPANPYLAQNYIGPQEGCWYAYYDGGQNTMTPAGGLPLQGGVTATMTGDIYKMVYEFYDRHQNKFSGTFEASKAEITVLEKTTRAMGPLTLAPSIQVK